LAQRLIISWETLAQILDFLRLFVFDLGTRTGQTDREVDGRTRSIMRPIMTAA